MSPRTRCGVQCVSHPALRCGVQWRESPRTTMRGPVRESPRTAMRGPVAGIPGFRIKCGMTGRVFLDTASHRVTPHPMRGPVCGSPRTTMRGPVRESPRTTMRGPVRESAKGKCRCRYSLPGYFWIPHQVRNDRPGIPGFRVAPGHPAPRCGVHLPVFLDTAS